MRLDIRKEGFGVDPEGQWWEKTEYGWVAIDKPEWANKPRPIKQVEPKELKMKPPKGKKHNEIQMVKVFRIQEKTVPDYEAEVLCRNGWQRSETMELVFKQLSIEDALLDTP